MEKGYRDYGHDIDNTDTVLEAGLGFAVALDKPGGFIGRDAVLAQKQAGPLTRRLVQVLLDRSRAADVPRRDRAPRRPRGRLHPRRVVRLDARRRRRPGDDRFGGAPIDQAWLDAGDWTVQIGDRIVPARASLRPLYDPGNKRIRM